MSPKYRQRGYMDDYDGEERPRGRKAGDEGAALTSLYKILICSKCNHRNQLLLDVSPATVCESCKKSLRTCKNCDFYSAGKRFGCALPVDQEITDKEALNQCPRFAGRYIREHAQRVTAYDARKALDKLFKK